MKKIKNKLITLGCILIFTGGIAGCSSSNSSGKETSNAQKNLIDEVVLGEGHPMYYCDIENVVDYAKKSPKKRVSVDIVGGEKYNEYTDETVLSINGFKHNGLVNDIQIYLENANESMGEKEAIELVNEYLPKDIIDKYYKEAKYEVYVPEDKSDRTYKVMEYDFNEEGDKAREDDEFKYRGNIYIILEEENDSIKVIRIYDDIPNWMSRPEFNGYEVKEWLIDK